MMMPKEGVVCFIAFFNKKNIWFGEKIKYLSQLFYWFYGGHFAFFVPKESLTNDSFTSAQISPWGTIHAQSKEKKNI